MKNALQFRMSQHLALTPQLQQSIRLLQLSTLELNQEIEQILADNPMLERDDQPLASPLHLAANGTLHDDVAESYPQGMNGEAPAHENATGDTQNNAEIELTRDTAPDTEGLDWEGGGGFEPVRRNHDGDDDDNMAPQLTAAQTTLREHLMLQAAVLHLEERDRGLVTALIELLDDDGYLRHDLQEILAMLPEELEFEETELATALHLVQTFDPPGVGARHAGECLALQLRPQHAAQEVRDADTNVVRLAHRLVSEHLELLAAHDFTRLKKVLQCDDARLRAAQQLIRTLKPHPGRAFSTTEAGYVIPDVIVRRQRDGWRVTLNGDVMPRLRIHDAYARVLREHRGQTGADNLASRLQEAKWLIKNVQQRFETILRVSQAIVERQKNFFTHGEVAMRPLVLREIADTLGLHESTVSRVTTNKYMLTPFGTFELKYFFGSHVATEAGGAASSTAIRALIKQLIGAEDRKKPLSDSKIASMLGEQGIVVARRTIAKYREALRIQPVSLRKML